MATPVYPATNNAEAIELNISNANQFFTILQGGIDDFIVTYEGNGEIPSVARALHEAAAYKAPLPWETTGEETQLLQTYSFEGGIYAPITVPAPFSTTPDSDFWRLLQTNVIKSTVDATSDPTVNNDETKGYSVNSLWINQSTSEVFRCLDATVGAAVWVKTTLTIDELGALAIANNASDVPYDNTASGYSATNVQEAIDNFAVNTAGQGSDLVAHTGTSDTVTEALDKRVIRVSSRTEMKAYDVPAGYQFSLEEGGRSGLFVRRAGTPPASDPEEVIYIIADSGGYDERIIDGPWSPSWAGIDPSNADNATAWQNLLNLNPSHVHYSKAGTYTFLSSSDHAQDISITGSSGVVIDCTDAGFTGDYWTKISGSITALPSLSVSPELGARSVTFASDPGLSIDDVFIIHNPTPSSWSGFRPAYCAGEFCRAVSVSGNTVTLAAELYDSYGSSSVDVYKLNSRSASVGGGFQIQGSASLNLLEFQYCRNVFLSNPNIYHQNNAAVVFDKCFSVYAQDPIIHNAGDGGDDYGISIANSQHVKIFGGNIFSRRHAVTTGGDAQAANVPCRDIRIIGATLSNDINSGTHCADFHGNTEDSSYENCEIYGGATWQGKDNGFVDCRIGSLAVGVCILGSEIKGGTHYARGCKFHTTVDPSATSRGVIDVGGNSNVLTANTVEDVYLEAIDNTLLGSNFSGSTSFMLFRNAGTEVRVNPTIDGLSMVLNDIGQILLTNLDAGTARSYRTIVDNIKDNGLADGKLLVSHQGDHYLNFPHKLQNQSGYEIVTTSTSSPSASSIPVAFKWAYPRIPTVAVSRNNRGYIGNRIGIAYADPVTETSLTPYVTTDDATNFSSAITVQLHWQAEISEI